MTRKPISTALALSLFVGLASGQTTVKIPVGTNPNGMSVDSVRDRVYTISFNPDGTVSVVDGATKALAATIPVAAFGEFGGDVLVDDAADRVYATVQGAPPQLAVIDGATDTVTSTVALGTGFGWLMGLDPAAGRLFVSTYDFSGPSMLFAVSTATNGVLTSASFAELPWAVAVDPVTGRVYVGLDSNELAVFDGMTLNEIARIPLGHTPLGAAFYSGRDEVYVGSQTTSEVSVVDVTTNTVVDTIPSMAGYVNQDSLTEATDTLYLASADELDNRILVLDVADRVVRAEYTVDSGRGIAAENRSTGVLYYASIPESTVDVLDLNACPQGGAVGSQQKLLASDGSAGDGFAPVAVDGDWMVVGAPGDGPSGAAYVFERSGSAWLQQAKLLSSDGRPKFGNSVDIDGDTLVVGAPNQPGVGAGYVFAFDGAAWSQQAILIGDDTGGGDNYAETVKVSGSTVVVGSNQHETERGTAYVFTRSGSTWTQEAKVRGNDVAALDRFATAIDIEGDTLVAGAFADDNGNGTDAGSAYVFTRSGSTWTQQAKLLPSDGSSDDIFGVGIALDGPTLVVGAGQADASATDSGAAYVFRFDGAGWVEEAKLAPSDLDAGASFGWRSNIGVAGDRVALSAYRHDPAGIVDAGAVYVFERCFGWQQTAKLVASDAATGDELGLTLDLADGVLVSGARLDDNGNGVDAGAVYAWSFGVTDSDGDGLDDDFELALGTDPNDPDTDDDGLSDGDEVDTYSTDPLLADTDGDGLSDGGEIAAQAFGCPDPLTADTDADGLDDGTEIALGLDACDDADFDGDGLMDAQEILVHLTDPTDPDTDGDGMLDGTEVDVALGTGCPDPLDPDSDDDNLLDGDEVDGAIGGIDLTDPCNPDTDGDGIPDDLDPLPTDPTGTEGFIATDLRALCDYVETLDLSVFLAPNDNAAKGRRNAICNKLNAAANSVTAGDVQGAIDQLESLRQKLDEAPSPKDWMAPGTQEIGTVVGAIDGDLVLLGYL